MSIIEIEAPSEMDSVLSVEKGGIEVLVPDFPRARIETIWREDG